MVRRKNSPLYDSFLLCRNSIRKDLSHIAHKRRNVRFKGLRRVHTPPQPLTAHTADHRAKQGRFGRGVVSLPSERFARFGDPARPGIRTENFAVFWPWSGALPKSAESLRNSDALMRVAVPRRRGPAGLRDPIAVSLTALIGFTVLLSRFVGTQKIERLFFGWYKISIAPEADRKPRRLCLFLL